MSRKDIFGITVIDNQHWLDRIRNLSKKIQRQAWMTEENGLFYKNNRLYIPGYRDIKLDILQELHDGTAGHFGYRKTLERVTRNFFWEGMAADIEDFVKSCEACQRSKSSTQKPFGTLNPISPPEDKFETFSMDFIGPLPTTKQGNYNGILVIVDAFTKAVSLAPMNFNYSAQDIAHIVFTRIIS